MSNNSSLYEHAYNLSALIWLALIWSALIWSAVIWALGALAPVARAVQIGAAQIKVGIIFRPMDISRYELNFSWYISIIHASKQCIDQIHIIDSINEDYSRSCDNHML